MLEPLRESLPPDLEVSLRYVRWQETPQREVLGALFWLPNDHVPHRRLYLRAGDFPAQDRQELARRLTDEAIPALCRWASFLHSLPDNATALMGELLFRAYVEDGEFRVSSMPLPDSR